MRSLLILPSHVLVNLQNIKLKKKNNKKLQANWTINVRNIYYIEYSVKYRMI